MSWRALLPSLAILALGVVSCGDGRGDGDACTMVDCRSGVAIDLGKPGLRYAASLPLAIHVCFDASCDDVVLADDRGHLTCGGTPGGAPDQLTACFVSDSGSVEIDIGRIDTRYYGDGASHTMAVSFRDAAGHVVHEAARSVVLPAVHPNGPSCDPVCYQASVSLD